LTAFVNPHRKEMFAHLATQFKMDHFSSVIGRRFRKSACPRGSIREADLSISFMRADIWAPTPTRHVH